jgi:hypothetical protein
MRADAREPDLAVLLGDALRLQQVVGHLGGLVLHVQVPDVEVVRSQLAQAGVQVGESLLPGLARALAGNNHPLPAALESGPHHAFVVSVLVTSRGVEMDDPDIGRVLNHALVRGGHAPKR